MNAPHARAPATLLILGALVAGCASARAAYVPVAEALTSGTLTEGIQSARRMFTSSQLVEACRSATRVNRLAVTPRVLQLRPGDRVDLKTINVVAVNAADVAVPGIPVVIEAQDVQPPIVGLRSDDADLDQGRLRALRTGTFRVRIRTLCGLPPAETMITGRVTP